jgi:hypothetical protein
MKRLFLWAPAGAAALVIASSLVHPFGRVKDQKSAAPILSGAAADPAVALLLERSCRNCHSGQTEWPWYSYIAPLSWMIESDVHEARGHMDLSQWASYPPDRQIELLAKIGVMVRNHLMPLPQYLRLHPEARLSADDIAHLYSWTRNERARLRNNARAAGE